VDCGIIIMTFSMSKPELAQPIESIIAAIGFKSIVIADP
jgi:hypothetical protein